MRLCSLALVAGLMLAPAGARADDDEPLRALGEEVLVLGLGFAQYASNKEGNAADWDLAPDWSSVERKLSLSALTFDNNYFDTNWLTHPAAGYLYYSAARQNRLSIPVSFLFALTSSTLWEFFGELREHAAINDLVATPVAGLALGESTLRLGSTIRRGRPTVANAAVGWLLSPLQSLHDLIDGIEPERSRAFDALGMPMDVWHRIAVGGSGGLVSSQGEVSRLGLRSRIVAIPGYGFAAKRSGWFSDGEVSELNFLAGLSEGTLVDLAVAGHVVPVGFAVQDVMLDSAGKLHGHGGFIGLDVGAEYSRHAYGDRRDRIANVSTGLTMEQRAHFDSATVRGRLDALATFAGVTGFALPEERAALSDIHLPSVLREKNYYHAYGATLRPRLDLEVGPFDTGSELRVDLFSMISRADVDPVAVDPSIEATDRRIVAKAWVGLRPATHVRVAVGLEWAQRDGRLGRARARCDEAGVHAGAELVF